MYQVQVFEDYKLLNPLTIHHATAFGNKLSKGEVKQILNGLDLFVCSLSLNNMGYRKVEPIKNIVIVKNTLTNSIVFEGRVREIVNTMSNMNETLHCESLLAYLYDSYQIYRGMGNDSVEAYFRLIIEQHNRTVEAHKRFKVGLVTVVNSTDNVYRGINYTSTMDLIKDKLINRLGGYLRYRRVNGDLVIDYLKEIGEVSETPLQLSKNLVNATKNLKSDELVTRIVPVGAEIETEDEPESSPNVDITRPRITIGDVNGGVLHLDDSELIKRFGVISKVVDWNDVNIPSILKQKGQNFLDNQRVFLTTWNIDAIELGLIDKRFEEFVIGNSYPIINPYLSSVETLQVIERSIDINNPQRSNLTIGNGAKTLSQYQLESRETEKTLEDLKYMYSSSERKLRLLKDQYDYLKEQSELIPEQQRLLEELAQRIKELEAQLNPFNPTVEQKLIHGIPKKPTTSNDFIILHESGNPNNVGIDSLDREVLNMTNNWQKAFVTHFVGSGGRIVQLATAGYESWGAGSIANPRSYAQIELSRTNDKAIFEKDYRAYIWLAKKLAGEAGIPLLLDGSGKGIKTHKWVSENLGDTDHTDPIAYFASWGITAAKLKQDIES
ncbi:MAG: phage tail protein [Carnobacterium sp.]|uniref:phage tail protein n=1 Tax=Carnobacterium sp. TaxID=48221 RepID=UPI002FC72BC4